MPNTRKPNQSVDEPKTPINAGMLQTGARVLLVPGWILAIAMTLKGYVDIGDGFSGGVIAALVVLTQGLAFGADELEQMVAARIAPMLSMIGLALAYAVAFVPTFFGHPIMMHFPRMNQPVTHFGVLEFITPVAFDVAVFLVVYGFCVGAVMAVARAESRHVRILQRLKKRTARKEESKA